MPTSSVRRSCFVLPFLACWLSPGPLFAQRVVRESAQAWTNARLLPLTVHQRWCTSLDAAGCDLRSFDYAVALPDGGILANDVPGPLHRFGPDGRFIGALARRGQGPGEYGFVVATQLVAGNRVVWFDNTQMRIASIGLDGKPGPVTRLMPPATMASLHLVGESLVILDIPAVPRRGDTVVATYRTVPATGAPRVLARVRTPSVFEPGSDVRPMAGPFQPRVVSDVSEVGDVAHSNGGRYQVDVFPVSGAPWRLEVELPVRRVTGADRDSVIEGALRANRVTSVGALPPAVRTRLESMPATFPPLTAIRVLRDGTLWIRPTVAAGARLARWDVFSRNGQRIGRVELPIAAGVRDGARGWVLVVEPGSDDLPSVVRYRVGA